MDKLIFGIGIFVIAWCVFAFFDFKKENDVLRVYGLSETGERTSSIDGSTLPKLGTAIDEYENCKIFDIKNFTCTYSDESATFGAKDGLYFERNNVEKFPHLADPLFNEMFGVTRFRYITTECQWWFTDDFINAVVGCALEPFTL